MMQFNTTALGIVNSLGHRNPGIAERIQRFFGVIASQFGKTRVLPVLYRNRDFVISVTNSLQRIAERSFCYSCFLLPVVRLPTCAVKTF